MSKKQDLQNTPPKKSSFGCTLILFLILITVLAGAAGYYILFETEKPIASFQSNISYIGKTTDIPFEVSDRRSGIHNIVLEIQQKNNRKELFRKSFDRQTWMNLQGAGPETVTEKAIFDLKQTQLKDGEAELILTVYDFSLNFLCVYYYFSDIPAIFLNVEISC